MMVPRSLPHDDIRPRSSVSAPGYLGEDPVQGLVTICGIGFGITLIKGSLYHVKQKVKLRLENTPRPSIE